MTEQKINDLTANILKLQNDSIVLMVNQEEMASIYKNGDVPVEITTNGGGTSVASGPDLAAYISQLLDKCTQGTDSSSSGSSGGDTNKNVDPKKQRVEIIWGRQFKYYCHSCGVNLHHGSKNSKKCPKQTQMKNHDESVTWHKKETPRNKDRCDRLWMQWCEPIMLKVHKDCDDGEVS